MKGGGADDSGVGLWIAYLLNQKRTNLQAPCLCSSDINECAASPCDRDCHNTPGSFSCSCDDDEVLLRDGRSCLGTPISCASMGHCFH